MSLPAQLAEIRDDFLDLEQRDRLQLLLEFSNELPELPEHYPDHPDLLERVEECQSPVFIFVEVDDANVVHLYATAPKEAPTTRGFASILVQGLAGLTVDEVLAVPDDYPNTIGLTEAVSPLRIRGMTGAARPRQAAGAREDRRVTLVDTVLRRIVPAADEVPEAVHIDDRDRLLELYAPRAPDWLRLNLVASVSGSAAGTDGTSESLTSRADRRILGVIRELADVVLVGANSVRAEGYRCPAARSSRS